MRTLDGSLKIQVVRLLDFNFVICRHTLFMFYNRLHGRRAEKWAHY